MITSSYNITCRSRELQLETEIPWLDHHGSKRRARDVKRKLGERMEVTKQAIEDSKKGKRLSIDSGISFPPGDDESANGVAVQTDRSMLPGNHGFRYL